MKRVLFSFVLVLGVFFARDSFASVLLQNLDLSDTHDNIGAGQLYNVTSTGVSGTTTRIVFYGSGNAVIPITVNSYISSSCTGGTYVTDSTSTLVFNSSPGEVVADLSLPVFFSSTGCLSIGFGSGSGNLLIYGSESNSYSFGSFVPSISGFSDPYFRIISSDSVSDFIDLTFPSSPTTPDFAQFFVEYSTAGSLPGPYDFVTVKLNYSDKEVFESVSRSNSTSTVRGILKQGALVNGSYTAIANLIINNQVVATSSPIAFSVVSGTYVYNFVTSTPLVPPRGLPFAGASSSLQDCSITSVGGCFINAGVYLAQFLFNPSDNFTNYLQDSVSSFQSIFPFSLVFDVTDTIENVASSSYGSQKNFVLPLPNRVSSTTIPILTSSTISNFVGASNKALILNIQEYIIWTATGFIIITMIL